MKRCAIFSCLGLGDGLIALVLSNNLQLNGYSTTTFHPFLEALQSWFPHLAIRRFPSPDEDIADTLQTFDRLFIFYEKSAWIQRIIAYCEQHCQQQTTILNPIATPNRDYPYWENGRFDGNLPFVDNLYLFCKDLLKLPLVTKNNGIVSPEDVKPKHFKQRVILHPTSSRPGKNWSREKFLEVAQVLKEEGYHPVFILAPEERQAWETEKIDAPYFQHLSELTAYVSESGWMIGNDSGIGHLSSSLGLPTLTICRSRLTARFWRPAWAIGEVITPAPWIPNIKGLRWRDRYWQKWITVQRVLKSFHRLQSKIEPLA